MENYYIYLFEFGAVFAFIFLLFEKREDKELFEILVLAFLYGILLEALNIHFAGTYFYARNFVLQIYDIPLAIGAGWALIYYSASKAADNYNLKWWQVPIPMALIALSVDLAIDPVAIRLGFWNWKMPLNREWFGAPYDNLFGWLAVVWTFSFFINLSGRNFFEAKFSRLTKYLAVIVSPVLLALQIIVFTGLSAVFSEKFTPGGILEFLSRKDFSYAYYPEVVNFKAQFFWAIVFTLTAYSAAAIYKNRSAIGVKLDLLAFAILFMAQLGFLAAIFTSGIYKNIPILVFVSISMLCLYAILDLFPYIKYSRDRKRR